MARIRKYIDIDDNINDITFELDKTNLKVIDPQHPSHYINNKELYNEFKKYYTSKQEALKLGKEIPPLTNKIGMAIIQIANRRCKSWRYAGYSNSWKEEMISNAILIATMRCHNFDPNKSNNPFAYLTQIINNGILEQLKSERKELYVKYKIMSSDGINQQYEINDNDSGDDFDVESEHSRTVSNEFTDNSHEDRLVYVDDYEDMIERHKNRYKKEKVYNKLDFS